MDTHAIHDTGELFADAEVIDLCNSIKDIHRALAVLVLYLEDLETPKNSTSNAARSEFLFWGIRAISEKFITDQNKKLTRLMEIYQTETYKLMQRTNPKGGH